MWRGLRGAVRERVWFGSERGRADGSGKQGCTTLGGRYAGSTFVLPGFTWAEKGAVLIRESNVGIFTDVFRACAFI